MRILFTRDCTCQLYHQADDLVPLQEFVQVKSGSNFDAKLHSPIVAAKPMTFVCQELNKSFRFGQIFRIVQEDASDIDPTMPPIIMVENIDNTGNIAIRGNVFSNIGKRKDASLSKTSKSFSQIAIYKDFSGIHADMSVRDNNGHMVVMSIPQELLLEISKTLQTMTMKP